MNELQNFTNGIFNLDVKVEGEEVLFSAEQVAKSLGLTQKQNKSGKIYESIRWETINKYLLFYIDSKLFVTPSSQL